MSDVANQVFFAGFALGTLLNDNMTAVERCEALAQKAVDLGMMHADTIPERKGERDPFLAENVCGICLNTYAACDCAETGRR